MRLRKKDSNLGECKGWTWKRSQCIKLYWECFLRKGFCSPSCSWEDWFNMEENEEEIKKIRNKIISRNPNAFQKKAKVTENVPDTHNITNSQVSPKKKIRHIKGCNWRKSQCSNNYCEWHQLGARCTDLCSCADWKN